ncbi:MAG: hypothetical protein MJ250_03335 [Alphaproteobacteria bacterium]|nr:hypothetical protein [Alphaproteobacteria bacterium]
MDLSSVAQQMMAMQQAQLAQQLALQATKAGSKQDQAIVDLISQSIVPAAKEGCGKIVDCFA